MNFMIINKIVGGKKIERDICFNTCRKANNFDTINFENYYCIMFLGEV